MAKQKGQYVDGFVLVVPKSKTSAYKKMASEGGKTWKKFGALEYKECMIDHAKPEHVIFTFPKMIKAKKNEVVWFSYIVFKNRAHRDMVNKKVMNYLNKKYTDQKDMTMPFDMKRMAYAGFKAVVNY